MSSESASTTTKHEPKSIIVTGGASGIGLAMSRHFASQGHRVAILDVNTQTGPQAAAEIAAEHPAATVVFKKCDVSSWDEQAAVFKEVFHEHGDSLDVVMANAGISEGGSVTVVNLKEAEPTKPRLTALEINLLGVIYCEFPPPFLPLPLPPCFSLFLLFAPSRRRRALYPPIFKM